MLVQGLDSAGTEMSLFEHKLLVLRQELQSSAQLAMTRSARPGGHVTLVTRGGVYSLEPLAVETELREVQLRSGELQRKRRALLDTLDSVLRRDPYRGQGGTPTPSPRQQVNMATWLLDQA